VSYTPPFLPPASPSQLPLVPPKKHHRGRNWAIAVVGLVVVLGLISLADAPSPRTVASATATTIPATTIPAATTVPGNDLEVCNAMATAIQGFVNTDNMVYWVIGDASLALVQGTTQDPVLANDVALAVQASNTPGDADAVIYGSAVFKECRLDFPNNAHLTQTWDNVLQADEALGN
jgi:uncharacterized lipoprotein YbaY